MRNRRFDVIFDFITPVTVALVVAFLAMVFMRFAGCV